MTTIKDKIAQLQNEYETNHCINIKKGRLLNVVERATRVIDERINNYTTADYELLSGFQGYADIMIMLSHEFYDGENYHDHKENWFTLFDHYERVDGTEYYIHIGAWGYYRCGHLAGVYLDVGSTVETIYDNCPSVPIGINEGDGYDLKYINELKELHELLDLFIEIYNTKLKEKQKQLILEELNKPKPEPTTDANDTDNYDGILFNLFD